MHRKSQEQQHPWSLAALMNEGKRIAAPAFLIIPIQTINDASYARTLSSYRARGFDRWSIFKTGSHIVRTHGVLSLWRGNSANVARRVIERAIEVAVVPRVHALVFDDHHPADSNALVTDFQTPQTPDADVEYWKEALFKTLMTCCTWTLVYPLHMLHLKMSVDIGERKEFLGLIDCFNAVISVDGVRGLWTGLGISLVGIALSHLVYYTAWKHARHSAFAKKSSFNSSIVQEACRQLGELVSYPTDYIRYELVLQAGLQRRYTGAVDCLARVAREDGVKELWRGVVFTIVRDSLRHILLAKFMELVGKERF